MNVKWTEENDRRLRRLIQEFAHLAEWGSMPAWWDMVARAFNEETLNGVLTGGRALRRASVLGVTPFGAPSRRASSAQESSDSVPLEVLQDILQRLERVEQALSDVDMPEGSLWTPRAERHLPSARRQNLRLKAVTRDWVILEDLASCAARGVQKRALREEYARVEHA